jgi:hypothetical protein
VQQGACFGVNRRGWVSAIPVGQVQVNHIVVIVWTVFKQQSLDLVGSPKQARAVLVVLVLRHILNQFLQAVMAGRLEGRTTPIQPN